MQLSASVLCVYCIVTYTSPCLANSDTALLRSAYRGWQPIPSRYIASHIAHSPSLLQVGRRKQSQNRPSCLAIIPRLSMTVTYCPLHPLPFCHIVAVRTRRMSFCSADHFRFTRYQPQSLSLLLVPITSTITLPLFCPVASLIVGQFCLFPRSLGYWFFIVQVSSALSSNPAGQPSTVPSSTPNY